MVTPRVSHVTTFMNIKKNFFTLIIVFLTASFVCTSCARHPSTKQCAKLIKHHFHKYGKKYRDTIYGKNEVKDVDVTSEQEIHKRLVAVEAFITLSDGTVQRINATIQKSPVGWRFVSWENATGM